MREGVSFYNWATGPDSLREAFNWPIEGLEFDAQNNVWESSWGPKPTTLGEQTGQLRAMVASAPKLIPVYGHRYLLGEPCAAGNPVLSVYQSDIIVYAADVRDYLLVDFMHLLGLSAQQEGEVTRSVQKHLNETYEGHTRIPFWGELL